MRHAAIAAACVAAATIPLLAAVLFLFGCCALPFHSYLHKAMPLCHLAADVMRGAQGTREQDSAQQPLPARGRQEPIKRLATIFPPSFRLSSHSNARRSVTPIDTIAYRSYIAFGALRCDQDIGLHLLAGTLLI